MKKKLEEAYVKKMAEAVKNAGAEFEEAHGNADYLLTEFLLELGYDALVAEYLKVKRYFA